MLILKIVLSLFKQNLQWRMPKSSAYVEMPKPYFRWAGPLSYACSLRKHKKM